MATRVQWLGHACLLIESDGKRVLIDPFLTGNPMAGTTADQVEADVILISHGHGDHVGDAVAIAKRTGAPVVANYEISQWLTAQGVASVHGLNLGGGVEVLPGIHVQMTLAFHSSSLPDGTYGGNPGGFLITCADGSRIYDAADTALFGDMKLIGEGGLDLAILPIGDYFTMGPADSIRAIKLLQPKLVLPIHYDTFPPIKQDVNAWAEQVKEATASNPLVPRPGDWSDIR
jgi:L-ascorbate metabolism protein UlaG (beta-lactamase superfamily)